MSSATANDVKVETYFDRVNDGTATGTPSWSSAQNTGDVTVPGTAGYKGTITTTHTTAQIDGAQKGEEVRLRVKRIAVTGTDATGDLEVRAIAVKET